MKTVRVDLTISSSEELKRDLAAVDDFWEGLDGLLGQVDRLAYRYWDNSEETQRAEHEALGEDELLELSLDLFYELKELRDAVAATRENYDNLHDSFDECWSVVNSVVEQGWFQ